MIKLAYSNDDQVSDLVRNGGNIESDESFETAAFISLFTRRRALPDDVLPEPLGSREGWWGDSYPDVDGDLIGSRLWLLSRSVASQSNSNMAVVYAEEALQWFVDDKIAKSVNAIAEIHRGGVLAIRAQIEKPTEPASRWVGAWNVHLTDL